MLALRASLYCAMVSLANGQFSVEGNQVELVTNPLAIDIDYAKPLRFNWIVTGAEQDVFRVLISSSSSVASADIWDSGPVTSAATGTVMDTTVHPLSYEQTYYWLVSVTATTGRVVNSSISTFSTGPSPSVWGSEAAWISGALQMRASFTLAPQQLASARLYVSGLGIFAAYVNGQRLGPGVLSPGWSTVPQVRHLYETYDVLTLLQAGGENVLGLRLGMGKWGFMGAMCDAGGAAPPANELACAGGLARLVLTDVQGNRTVVGTQPGPASAWRGTGNSPITFDNVFDGESYDGRVAAAQAGWNAPGFVPTSDWLPLAAMNSSLIPSSLSPLQLPVVVHADVQPLNVTLVTTGPDFNASSPAWVFDLGYNMAGYCTLTIPGQGAGAAGTVVTLAHTEIVHAPGPQAGVFNTYGASVPPRKCGGSRGNCADQMEQYTMAGVPVGQSEVYTPTFTVHGFRWVGLYGWPAGAAAPGAEALTCHHVYTDVGTASSLSFGVPRTSPGGAPNRALGSLAPALGLPAVLQGIQDAIVLTESNNMVSLPTDCITREKRGWMGDAQASAHQALYNLQAEPLYEEWLRTFADTLAVGCAMPTGQQEEEEGGVTSADLYPLAAVRPDGYTCCGNISSFGCQPGQTPMDAQGSLPDVIPYEFKPYGGWPGDTIWQIAAEIIPAALLSIRGDVVGASRLYDTVVKPHMTWTINAAAGTGGLLQWGYYGDWNAAEGTTKLYAENVWYVLALQEAAVLAAALGRTADAAAFTAIVASTSTAMAGAYYNASAGYWDNGSSNAQALALVANIGGADVAGNATAQARIRARLQADVAAHDYNPTGGVASIRYILQGIELAGFPSSALSMASSVSEPSWGWMIFGSNASTHAPTTPPLMGRGREGAAYAAQGLNPGTIWEAWHMNATSGPGSYDHPMFSGGIGEWLHEQALGVRVRYSTARAGTGTVEGTSGCAQLHADLAYDPVRAFGLDPASLHAACTLHAGTNSVPVLGRSWSEVRAQVGRVLGDTPAVREHSWVATAQLTLAPSPSVFSSLGAAQGVYTLREGPVTAAWHYGQGQGQGRGQQVVRMGVTPRSGMSVRMAVPTESLSEGVWMLSLEAVPLPPTNMHSVSSSPSLASMGERRQQTTQVHDWLTQGSTLSVLYQQSLRIDGSGQAELIADTHELKGVPVHVQVSVAEWTEVEGKGRAVSAGTSCLLAQIPAGVTQGHGVRLVLTRQA